MIWKIIKLDYEIINFVQQNFQAFKIAESFPDFRHTALIMWLSLWGLYMIETLAGIIFYKEEKKVQVRFIISFHIHFSLSFWFRRLIQYYEVYRSASTNYRRHFSSTMAMGQKWNKYRKVTVTVTATVTNWQINLRYARMDK